MQWGYGLWRTITVLWGVLTLRVVRWIQLLLASQGLEITRRPSFPPTNTHTHRHVTWQLGSNLLHYCLYILCIKYVHVCISYWGQPGQLNYFYQSFPLTHPVMECCPTAWLRVDRQHQKLPYFWRNCERVCSMFAQPDNSASQLLWMSFGSHHVWKYWTQVWPEGVRYDLLFFNVVKCAGCNMKKTREDLTLCCPAWNSKLPFKSWCL